MLDENLIGPSELSRSRKRKRFSLQLQIRFVSESMRRRMVEICSCWRGLVLFESGWFDQHAPRWTLIYILISYFIRNGLCVNGICTHVCHRIW